MLLAVTRPGRGLVVLTTLFQGLLLAAAYLVAGAAIYQGYWRVEPSTESVIVMAAAGLASLTWSFVLRMREISGRRGAERPRERQPLDSSMPRRLLAYGLALYAFAWLTSLVMHVPCP